MKIKVTNCFRLDHSDTVYGDNTLGFTDFSVKEFDDLSEALSYYNSEMELWMEYLEDLFQGGHILSVDTKDGSDPLSKRGFTYMLSGTNYTYFMPTISYGKPASV
jgi:hypothetical protein